MWTIDFSEKDLSWNNVSASDLKQDDTLRRISLMPRNLKRYIRLCDTKYKCILYVNASVEKILAIFK